MTGSDRLAEIQERQRFYPDAHVEWLVAALVAERAENARRKETAVLRDRDITELRAENERLRSYCDFINDRWLAEQALSDTLREALQAVEADSSAVHSDRVWKGIQAALAAHRKAREV
jgi:hypothetical protein